MDFSEKHNHPACPLCDSRGATLFWQGRRRSYWQCPRCRLVFVPHRFHLSLEAEKAEYDLHRNNPGDAGYRKFLNRLFEPLQARLAPHSHGLDFGCGPGPALALMFKEAGHTMSLYDPHYAPDPTPLDRSYDFITTTEVIEHLARPRKDLAHLWKILKPGGRLGIMTKQVKSQTAFSTWHYKNDPTHISFFSRSTFRWLAGRWRADLDFIGADVVILTKRPHDDSSRES